MLVVVSTLREISIGFDALFISHSFVLGISVLFILSQFSYHCINSLFCYVYSTLNIRSCALTLDVIIVSMYVNYWF